MQSTPASLTVLTLALTFSAAIPGHAAPGPKPLFSSHIVTAETVGHSVAVDVDLTGAKKLFLVVRDGGDSFACDWADWVEPVLHGDYGVKKLTELKRVSAETGWGSVGVNHSAGGQALIVNGQPVADGYGVHAPSMLEFDLPEGTRRFTASGALDKGGVGQNGGSSVVFEVYTEKPKLVSAGGGAAGAKSPEESLEALEAGEGLRAELFAAEPMLLSPSAIDVDAAGRVWVAEIVNYRGHNGERPEGDRILVLEDTDGDGKADKQTVFHQGRDIDSPHGVTVLGNRVIVSAQGKITAFIDDNGDLKADRSEVLFTGVHGAQHDHGVHTVRSGPDGLLYFNIGNEGGELRGPDGSPIVDKAGNTVRAGGGPYQQGMIFRCRPDGTEVETLAWNFRNNWECCTDSFGSIWQSDNDDDGNKSVRINWVMPYGNYGFHDELTGAAWEKGDAKTDAEVARKHWHQDDPGVVPNLLITGGGSPTGITVYEGDLLPEVFRGQVLHCDAGPNIVRAYPVKKDGAGYSAEIVNILEGKQDRWFRPSDVVVAPDGSLFIADWYDPGVGGHGMGDTERGRIYRIVPAGHKAGYFPPPAKWDTPEAAVSALASPCEATRYLGWTSLMKKGAASAPALEAMAASPNPRLKARALWALSKLPGKGDAAVKTALADKDPDIRVTGIRMALELGVEPQGGTMMALVNDSSPAVRREVALSLRFNKALEMPAFWAALAARYDGADRWYLEALGIGAALRWDECLNAYLKVNPRPEQTAAGRGIVQRSRAAETAGLLATALTAPGLSEKEVTGLMRAFDFQPKEARAAALEGLLRLGRGPIAGVVSRMEGFDYNATAPEIRAGIDRFLNANPGTAEYFQLVEKYGIATQAETLLTLAVDGGGSAKAGEAVKLLFRFGKASDIAAKLRALPPEPASKLAGATAAVGTKEAAALVLALVKDQDTTATVEEAAITALGTNAEGQQALLTAADSLSAPQKEAAGRALALSTDAGTREAGAKAFGMTAEAALPPVAELAKRTGDPAQGAEVFLSLCATCHQVNGTGIDFGPGLGEIGSKLAKEAIYDSILRPSAAISFGFEGHEITMKDGNTFIGMIAAETAGEIDLKVPGGVIQKCPKADIASRKKLDVSLMTPNLHTVISQDQLVDLVEYLASLKKK